MGIVAEDLPAPLPLLVGDCVCLTVVKVESPLVSIVQLIVLIQQLAEGVQPPGRNPVCGSAHCVRRSGVCRASG